MKKLLLLLLATSLLAACSDDPSQSNNPTTDVGHSSDATTTDDANTSDVTNTDANTTDTTTTDTTTNSDTTDNDTTIPTRQIVFVDNGQSPYTIVIPEKSPYSITNAAQTLQADLKEVTGAELPIVKDVDADPNTPFISLGQTTLAAAADINADAIQNEGFRTVTRGDNLFIIGPDTAGKLTTTAPSLPHNVFVPQPDVPGPQQTPDHGFKNGTAAGTYAFLEEVVGMRWLFPGDLGRVAPTRPTLEFPEGDTIEESPFIFRLLPQLTGPSPREGDDWRDRHKLGFSYKVRIGHNFHAVPDSMWNQHPEWFGMNSKGVRPNNPVRKLETTNQELVQYFAQLAIDALKADPTLNVYSVAPSDGWEWSMSPESKAYYDEMPGVYPGNQASVTRLILKWYRDIAAIVAREYPQGKIGGFLYSNYQLPPADGNLELPTNLTIQVATGSDACYNFSRSGNPERFNLVLDTWAPHVTHPWFSYNLPNWWRFNRAQVTPLAPDHLNIIFKSFIKNKIDGATFYGHSNWSDGAPFNYTIAKMMWNPTLDAREIERDWLLHAYGPEAGLAMLDFYNQLTTQFIEFFSANPAENYNNTENIYKNLFGKNYPSMESSFLLAAAKPMTDRQKERIQLIENNLIVLQWRMRQAGYLPADFSSTLTRTSEQVDVLLNTLDQFNGLVDSNRQVHIPVQIVSTLPTTTEPFPNPNHFIIHATQDIDLELEFSDVNAGAAFNGYIMYRAAVVREYVKGVMFSGKTTKIPLKKDETYYLSSAFRGISRGPLKREYTMKIKNAALTQANTKAGVVYIKKTTKPLSVFVPATMSETVSTNGTDITIIRK